MPLTVNSKKTTKASEVKETNEKAVAATEAQAPVTEAAPAGEIGCDSDKLIFVAPLGDPSKPDSTPITMPDGTTKSLVTSTIVGYRLKATIDLDIPDVAPGDDFKNNPMSYTGDVTKTRHVKAGEEFDLTKFETGVLVSPARFNGKILGGDKPMACTYTSTKKVGSNGAIATTTAASAIPSIALRALNPGVSIKDYKMIDVLACTTEKVGNTTKKHRVINPGFEKFAPLAKETVRAQRAGAGTGAATATNQRNKNAETFLAIVQKQAARAKAQ